MTMDSMQRGFYFDKIEDFLKEENDATILWGLTHGNMPTPEQQNAWEEEVQILKGVLESEELKSYQSQGGILLEYKIPGLGKRIDTVVLLGSVIFVIEFKVGKKSFSKEDVNQLLGYARSLRDFHEGSHDRTIIPILVATDAPQKNCSAYEFKSYPAGKIFPHILSNKKKLVEVISGCLKCLGKLGETKLDPEAWAASRYSPTPTIIEAVCALYASHSWVVSNSEAEADDLDNTCARLCEIIDSCKNEKRKAICFVTGVPGAGKTLVGLNVAARQWKLAAKDKDNLAVYLSGNAPLVRVLTKALSEVQKREYQENEEAGAEIGAEDADAMDTKKISIEKGEIERTFKGFIRMIHHYRDDRIVSPFSDNDKLSPVAKIIINSAHPVEHIAIFDEAQRSWTSEKLTEFMKKKRNHPDFPACSEPEFLVSCLERHKDWAVIVCLVGGGQEIHDGEAGIAEWFRALKGNEEVFSDWDIYVPSTIKKEDAEIEKLLSSIKQNVFLEPSLNLPTEKRSIRADLYPFVRSLLELNAGQARKLHAELQEKDENGRTKYPIYLTRSVEKAKKWLKEQANNGAYRCGILAASGAKRLRPFAIDVRSSVQVENWFLSGSDDVRSSNALEDVATEFDVQGLEIDWACIVWDADFRYTEDKNGENPHWEHYCFKGTSWTRIKQNYDQRYLENAYRVLLTRARQGMVIVVPDGDKEDISATRLPGFYDSTYKYLRDLGLEEI